MSMQLQRLITKAEAIIPNDLHPRIRKIDVLQDSYTVTFTRTGTYGWEYHSHTESWGD